MSDLFAATTRPDEMLLFHRNEEGDPRLGEVVRWHLEDYVDGQVILLGCPQDEGVRRNGGRVGAGAAPDSIRTWLYRLVAPAGVTLFDLGNTIIQPTLEETHLVQQQIVEQIIADGKTLIVLGGGNDLSYPDCAGLAHICGEVLAFNIDAHLDVRDNPIRNSGTPYRMLLEGGHLQAGNFYEMAYQPFAVAHAHLHYVREKGNFAYSLRDLREQGVMNVFQRILAQNRRAIFWGIDVDSVNSAEAPGVSAPNPLGLGGDELCQITELAGRNPNTRLIEFTEVNPTYDLDNRTSRLVAVAIHAFLSAREEVV